MVPLYLLSSKRVLQLHSRIRAGFQKKLPSYEALSARAATGKCPIALSSKLCAKHGFAHDFPPRWQHWPHRWCRWMRMIWSPLLFSLKSSMNCGFLIEIANLQTKAARVNITVPPKQQNSCIGSINETSDMVTS